jgi:hypothetical protein
MWLASGWPVVWTGEDPQAVGLVSLCRMSKHAKIEGVEGWKTDSLVHRDSGRLLQTRLSFHIDVERERKSVDVWHNSSAEDTTSIIEPFHNQPTFWLSQRYQGEQHNLFHRYCPQDPGPCTCRMTRMQGTRLTSYFVHRALMCSHNVTETGTASPKKNEIDDDYH